MKLGEIKYFILMIAGFYMEAAFGQSLISNPVKGGGFYFYCDGGKIEVYSWEKDSIWVNSENGGASSSSIGNNTQMRVFSNNGRPLKCEIKVPFDQLIDIKSAGGDIEFHGKYSGKVSITSLSGNIRIENLNNDAELSAVGGDIITGNINGNVKIHGTTGNIRMGIISGKAEISTSGGNIEIGKSGNSCVLFTRAGNINTGDLSGTNKINSGSGNIMTGNISGSADINSGGGEIKVKSAKGNIKAYTAGGDLILNNIMGSLNAWTEGGKIVADLNPLKSGINSLSSGFGDIYLSLPKNVKTEIEPKINLKNQNAGNNRYLSKIKSDFKGNTGIINNSVTGRYIINGGGSKIYIETTNSNIELRKR